MNRQQPRRQARAIAISAAETQRKQLVAKTMGALTLLLGTLAFWTFQHVLMTR